MAENDIDKAVEEVDKLEDEAAEKRNEEADSFEQKDEDDLIICPKCKSLINEQDFIENELSEMGTDSIMSRITCPKCGYTGLPIEVSKEEYLKFGSKPK